MTCERLENGGFICFGPDWGEPFCYWAQRALDIHPQPQLLPPVKRRRPSKSDEDVRARRVRAHYMKVARRYRWKRVFVGPRKPRGMLVAGYERDVGYWVWRQSEGRRHVFYPDDRCDDPKCCPQDGPNGKGA